MILRILFLICAVFASPSKGRMSLEDFVKNFEDLCFQNEPTDPFRLNGQDVPLSNTLENFIALVERMEVGHSFKGLADEVAYFLGGYFFENIKFDNGISSVWNLDRANLDVIDNIWELSGYNTQRLDSFSAAEKCSLFHMISHSILEKDTSVFRSKEPRNFSSRNIAQTQGEINPDDYFPQEMGVVAIPGTDAAVSLSRVLKGIFMGLADYRQKHISQINEDDYDDEDSNKLQIPENELPKDKTVDTLFAVTLADVVLRAAWPASNRQGLAPNGIWTSIPINPEKRIEGFCPMVYKQEIQNSSNVLPAYSYSSVRGAVDGVILGLATKQFKENWSVKLSQILRMYYSPEGISLQSPDEDLKSSHVSVCDRKKFMESLDSKLPDQMKLYAALMAKSLRDFKQGYDRAEALYSKEKDTIFDDLELEDYCSRSQSLERKEQLPIETNLDVIVVMDSSNSKGYFEDQQMIAGYLAKYMDLRYTSSQMTILLDQRVVSEYPHIIQLKQVVSDTYSSSCAACTVAQIDYERSNVERDAVIEGLDQFLQEKKENETQLYGVNGKVVVFFNYETNEGRDNITMGATLERALRDLHLHHQDVVFYAVGVDSELLQKYTKNDPSLVFLSTNGTLEKVAKKLFTHISFVPALLQYTGCTSEKNADKRVSYESLVSPDAIQYYVMPPQYFHTSQNVSFKFESSNGNIRVCHSRITQTPENDKSNCNQTTGNGFVEFKMSNPCNGLTKETCAPLYFSVMGMNSTKSKTSRDYCTDLEGKWCATLDQVKFTVSHTGVQCRESIGIEIFTSDITIFPNTTTSPIATFPLIYNETASPTTTLSSTSTATTSPRTTTSPPVTTTPHKNDPSRPFNLSLMLNLNITF